MIISHISEGHTIYFELFNVYLGHDIEEEIDKINGASHLLIFNRFHSRLRQRITEFIKNIFPMSNTGNKRVLTFSNKSDFISFKHHNFQKEKYN